MFLLSIKKNLYLLPLLYFIIYTILETIHTQTIVVTIYLDFSGLTD